MTTNNGDGHSDQPMTASEVRECLNILHWPIRILAAEVNRNHRQVFRWLEGAQVPPTVAAWLRDLAAYHRSHPSPCHPDKLPQRPATRKAPTRDARKVAGSDTVAGA